MSTKLAHIHDPQVSYDAAYNLSPVASEAAMHLIVDLIARHGPLTPKELERIYGQRRFTEPDWPTVAPFSNRETRIRDEGSHWCPDGHGCET